MTRAICSACGRIIGAQEPMVMTAPDPVNPRSGLVGRLSYAAPQPMLLYHQSCAAGEENDPARGALPDD